LQNGLKPVLGENAAWGFFHFADSPSRFVMGRLTARETRLSMRRRDPLLGALAAGVFSASAHVQQSRNVYRITGVHLSEPVANVSATGCTTEEFAKLLASDIDRLGKVIRDAGIKAQ
jgi:hypothetical protein